MNGTVSAPTQPEATGVEAKDHIAHFYVYYDPNGHRLVVINEELHLNIVNEDNFLNKAIEDMHDANEKLEAARDACLKTIDAASSPDKVDPSAYQKLVARFDAAQVEANKKREVMDSIHKALDKLEEREIKPIHQVNTIKELIPVASSIGNKFLAEDKVRYVRPSTAFARATGGGSVEWREVEIKEEEKNFLRDGKFDADVFKKELANAFKKPDMKIQGDFSEILPESLQMKTEFLAKFAENWSKALQYDSDKARDNDPNLSEEERMSNIFSFSAAAQFLRWTHGVGIKGDFDPKSFRGSIKAEGRAELALLEGKANFKWQIPDRRGWMLSLPNRHGVNADLGLIRLVFEILFKGFVGATLAGEVSVTVDASGLIKGENAQNDNPAPDPAGSRFDFDRFANKPESNSTANVNAGVGAFVGAEGTGEFSFAIEWKNPENRSKYSPFAKYLLGVSGQVGAGAQAKFAIGYKDNVGYYIEARAGLCFGYGAKGYMKLSIDVKLIGEFFAWFVYQLRNVDFQYIRDLIKGEDYKDLCMIHYLLIAGTYAMEGLQPILHLVSRVADDYRAHNDRMKLMKRLWDDPELVKHATPEVKGNIIYMLSDRSFFTTYSFSADNMRIWEKEAWRIGTMKDLKKVVLNIFKYTQSKREYENIMQFMSLEMGVKGDAKANEKTLLEFLDATELNHWLFKWASTDYDGDFREWLKTLSEEKQKEARHSGVTFYDQLPDHALRGEDIEQTYLANVLYCNGNCHYTQPSYTAAEFLTCHAENVWECETIDTLLAQNTDASVSFSPDYKG